MTSLRSRLGVGLVASLVVMIGLLWLMVGQSVEVLLEQQMASRLAHDGEALLGGMRIEADGRVQLQELALAEPELPLQTLSRPLRATVPATAGSEEIAEVFAGSGLLDLPVVDLDGVLLGVLVNTSLVQTVQEETTADIQAMVGASREERALSSPLFAVKKRMPWLQINLLTAFLAAAVVGLFENTIAQGHRPGHAVAGGRRPVRQHRRAGAGGDHAGPGPAGDHYPPLVHGHVQRGARRLSQRISSWSRGMWATARFPKVFRGSSVRVPSPT